MSDEKRDQSFTSVDDNNITLTVIERLSQSLESIIEQNERLKQSQGKVLDISIKDYFLRFKKYLPLVSSSVYIRTALLLDELIVGGYDLNRTNCHSTIAACLLLVYRDLEDAHYTNTYFMQIAGYVEKEDKEKFSKLVLELFAKVGYKITIIKSAKYDEYKAYEKALSEPEPAQEIKKPQQTAPATVAPKATHFQPPPSSGSAELLELLKKAQLVGHSGRPGKDYLLFPNQETFDAALKKLKEQGYRQMIKSGDDFDFRLASEPLHIEIKGCIRVIAGTIKLEPPPASAKSAHI